jgi:hypothetical protein
MRFSTPQEVLAYANKAAREDIRRTREYGIDLNPFCTDGARNDWQRGYDNLGPRPYESPENKDFDTIYQRGRAVGRLKQDEPHLFEEQPVKEGDRVVTPYYRAGTVTAKDVCNDAPPGFPPKYVTLNRWGVKLDDPVKAAQFKDGIAYFPPHELAKEIT